MARKRMIAQQIWDDPDFSSLDIPEQLLFIGMVTFADDYGHLPARPATLKKWIFGYRDDVTNDMVETWRDNIIRKCRNVCLYPIDGQQYIEFQKWTQYQELKYKTRPLYPEPSGESYQDLLETKEDKEDAPEILGNPGKNGEILGNPGKSCAQVRLGKVRLGKDRLEIHGAGAPAADKPPRPKSQKAEQNETRLALEVYFADTTGLPRPKSDTEQQRRSAGTLWWGPLRDIAELCAWNVQEATDLIDKSLERLSGMTISSPKSILQTALAIYSESNRTRPDSADYLCPICNSSPCRCEKHEQSPEEIAAGKLHDRWILIEPQLRALNVLGLFNGRELVGEDNGKLVVRVKSRELLDAKPELLRRITSAGIAIEGEKNDETR